MLRGWKFQKSRYNNVRPVDLYNWSYWFYRCATALEALKAGYRLRIGVRKDSDQLKKLLSSYSDQTEFGIISDLTEEAAIANKLDGVDYVLHLASPVPHGIPEGGVVKETNDWDLTVDPNANFVDLNDPVTSAMKLYQASKLLTDKTAWDFWKTNKPHYSLVILHPWYVFGHNFMQVSAKEAQAGSNGILWHAVMKGTPAGDLAITGVHIQDVAEAHIKALQPEIKERSKYVLAGKPTTWNDVARIVRETYPNIGSKLTKGAQGASVPTDTSKAENELGINRRSWEEMARSVIDQQLPFLQS